MTLITHFFEMFTPSFFIVLALIILLSACIVAYVEYKIREQNNTIVTTLRMVSALAEDVNQVKMGLNHLAIRGGQGFPHPNVSVDEFLGVSKLPPSNNKLIEVSDDGSVSNHDDSSSSDDDDYEVDDIDDVDDDNCTKADGFSNDNDDDDCDDDEDDDEDDDNDCHDDDDDCDDDEDDCDKDDYKKNIKININVLGKEFQNKISDNDLELIELIEEEPPCTNTNIKDIDDLDPGMNTLNDIDIDVVNNVNTVNLKNITIDLEKENGIAFNKMDYHKLTLPKLKTIALEKGLASSDNIAKMKKVELLKLLEI